MNGDNAELRRRPWLYNDRHHVRSSISIKVLISKTTTAIEKLAGRNGIGIYQDGFLALPSAGFRSKAPCQVL
jgi:hypothetical protein